MIFTTFLLALAFATSLGLAALLARPGRRGGRLPIAGLAAFAFVLGLTVFGLEILG
jgi:hypothetical protein